MWVADGDLDVRFEFDACSAEGGRTFLENATHGLDGDGVFALKKWDCVVEHEAVAVAFEPVVVTAGEALVLRKFLTSGGEGHFEGASVLGKLSGKPYIKQIKAMAELDDGTEDGGAFDFAAFAFGLLLCPLQGAGGAVFPKVDAVPEPVVGVFAGEEFGLSG